MLEVRTRHDHECGADPAPKAMPEMVLCRTRKENLMPETLAEAKRVQPGLEPQRTVAVWDLPTRLFHWTLVVLLAMAWVSRNYGDAGLVWHAWNGYALLVLIVWRLLWGVVGSSTARFRSFLYGPSAALRYAIDFAKRRPRPFLGHNPAGSFAVFAMLGLVGAQGFLGLFSYDDHDALVGGPLSSKVPDAVWSAATQLHHIGFDLIVVVVAVHVAASILYVVWKGENVVRAMLTGRKAARSYEDAAEAQLASPARALVCLMAAAAIVFGGIVAAGGKLL